MSGQFLRDMLPAPADVLARAGVAVKRAERTQLIACCPFHAERNASFAMNAKTGAFKCLACGEGGSDHLDFYQRVTGLCFKDAAQELGAWEWRQ